MPDTVSGPRNKTNQWQILRPCGTVNVVKEINKYMEVVITAVKKNKATQSKEGSKCDFN